MSANASESASFFSDKAEAPTRSSLEELISAGVPLLLAIEDYIRERCGVFQCEWKFYGKRAGWTVAYEHGSRRLFHLIPQEGRFVAVLVLGKRAVSACLESGLPDDFKRSILEAREYVEGRSIRVDVRSEADAAVVNQLIAIKLAN